MRPHPRPYGELREVHAVGHRPLLLLVLVLLALLAGVLVTWLAMRPRTSTARPVAAATTAAAAPTDPAYERLRLRLANGEISADDYRAAAAALGYDVGAPPPPAAPPPASPPPAA